MNYSVSPDDAWSSRIEVNGFTAGTFASASGASLGTVTSSANSVTRYITFSVDKAALGGTPGAGWAFTVALTGQDGTHGVDQTRAFSATPGAYSFGVCADGAAASALCSADPGSVPKVLDALTPAGVSQSDELDYTAGAVVLQGVPLP